MAEYYGEKSVKAKKRGQGPSSSRTREELDEMSASGMRKALELASYVVPLGMGVNALRLAYKGYKAGKTAIGLARKGQETVKAASQARKNKLITAGEQRATNREAALRAQRAADRAKAAKTKANTAGKVAAGSGVVGVATGSMLNSGTKTNTSTTKKGRNRGAAGRQTSGNTITTSSSTRSGNIGRTTTKYDGKARVAPKPDFKDDTKKKKKYGESGMGMAAYQRLNRGRG